MYLPLPVRSKNLKLSGNYWATGEIRKKKKKKVGSVNGQSGNRIEDQFPGFRLSLIPAIKIIIANCVIKVTFVD